MPKNIIQKQAFNTTPNKLYNFYMNEKLHTEITREKTIISKEIGSTMSAGGKYIKGKILHLKPNKMIVQTWRASDWTKEDMDSILILTFTINEDETASMTMSHSNVPDDKFEELKKGWKEHYWSKWKKYIKDKEVK